LKKVIITGHTGFIGSHLYDLLSENYDVIGISESKSPQILNDITKIRLDDLPKDIHCIIHLAAITDTQLCEKNPELCFKVNVMGTQNMLEISRKLNTKFIFASTSHVYGNPTKNPVNENSSRNISGIYSGSKIAAEDICESYAKSYEMDVSIVRIFSVFGPHSSPHLIISQIFSQLQNSDIINLGNLEAKRDFIFIDDVTKAIKIILEKSNGFNVYNIGTGVSHSIKSVFELIKNITNRNLQVNSHKSKYHKVEIPEIYADNQKIKKLGWNPSFNLKQGLQTLNS